MAVNNILTVLFVLLLLFYGTCAQIGSNAKNCNSSSSLVGFTAQLSMLQHQLRGQIEILDDCTFRVTEFDMIAGEDVYWWGSKGEDFENMTNGFVISDIELNRTYNSESMVVNLNNYTLEDFQVLGVWDKAFESDFGHIVLSDADNAIGVPEISPSPAPAPWPGGTSSDASQRNVYWGSRQPTMFENCVVLNQDYRLRWTLNQDSQTVDLGLEAAVSDTHYMAFGWAQPGKLSHFMMNADVVIGGFRNHTNAFVEDYYITKYSVCTWGKDEPPMGVCPDSLYPGNDEEAHAGSLKFIHGQWQDGVAFIRYQRPLQSSDTKFDVSINVTDDMDVIWALGVLKLPDTLRPHYLPENHGNAYGHLKLNLSKAINECKGPLQATNSDEPDLIVAESGSDIVVSVGPATHYPNPPNPDKVIYLNKIEAPVLKVERGVQVTFSIQAGHDMAFYVTEDPVGGEPLGNATIYAGGANAHGVPANPFKLTWKPDRLTPDEVYYQSYFEKKMGWKIQVVDGGLKDMYNSSILLADQMVMLYWILTESGISFAVRGARKSGYVAIGFGEKMVNTFAYVGWVHNEICTVNTYWINGREPKDIHPTTENITDVKCEQQNGMLTFQFSRALDPECTGRQECQNVIDPSIPLKVVWAMGTQWNGDHLTSRNMHSLKSSKYMSVYLTKGIAEAEQELRPVLAVHGFIMFVAWALLFPGGVLAARYLKHLKNDGWFQIHVYSQYSGVAVMFLGLLFAVAEIREFRTGSLHVKLGLTSILLACWQPVNAFFRPKKPAPDEQPSSRRSIWEHLHKYSGRFALIIGFISLFTGISALSSQYEGAQMRGLGWALFGWLCCIVFLICYLEYHARKTNPPTKGTWVIANTNEDEDDSSNLLTSSNFTSDSLPLYPANGREIQLQEMR